MSNLEPPFDPPFLGQHILRLSGHVGHRSTPPTRYRPWTNMADPDVRFAYPGLVAIDPAGNEAYCYLAPNLTADEPPTINVHFGGDGRPEFDPVVATVEVSWNA